MDQPLSILSTHLHLLRSISSRLACFEPCQEVVKFLLNFVYFSISWRLKEGFVLFFLSLKIHTFVFARCFISLCGGFDEIELQEVCPWYSSWYSSASCLFVSGSGDCVCVCVCLACYIQNKTDFILRLQSQSPTRLNLTPRFRSPFHFQTSHVHTRTCEPIRRPPWRRWGSKVEQGLVNHAPQKDGLIFCSLQAFCHGRSISRQDAGKQPETSALSQSRYLAGENSGQLVACWFLFSNPPPITSTAEYHPWRTPLQPSPGGLAVLSNNQTWPCRRLTLRYWMEGEERVCGIPWNDSRHKYSHDFTAFTTYCLISVFFVIIGPSMKYDLNCAKAHFADVAPAKVICSGKGILESLCSRSVRSSPTAL